MDPRRVTWRDPLADPPPREHSDPSVGAYQVEHNVRKDLDCLYTQRNAQEEVDPLAGRGGGAPPLRCNRGGLAALDGPRLCHSMLWHA